MAAGKFAYSLTSIFMLFLLVKTSVGLYDLRELKDGNELTSAVSQIRHVIVLFCEEGAEEACAKAKKAVQFVYERLNIEGLKAFTLHDTEKSDRYGLKNLPKMVFYRSGQPILYPDPLKLTDEIILWFEANLEVSCKELDDDNFEHDTQAATGATTGDWFVMFYHSEECPGTIPLWEAVASKLKQRVNVAKVDTKTNKKLVERFQLTECLTFKFFRLGLMYDFTFKQNRDVVTFVTFAEGWYQNTKSQKVPLEPSPFDKVAEEAAKVLKEFIEKNGVAVVVGICVGGAVVFVLIIMSCLFAATKKEKVKDA